MDIDVDHYTVLGLASGEQGAKLTEKDITRAYRAKALELHPDKRPDDPNSHDNFQRLKSSYEILKDEKARKLFDDLLRVKRDQLRRHSERDSKRRRMVSDLEERERAAFATDPVEKAREEEEIITRKLNEEITRIRAMHSKKTVPTPSVPERGGGKESSGGAGIGLDKGKVLKVSWGKIGEGYSAERLREVFSEFGEVEDVVIKHSKKKGSALVVMATKDAAVAATGTVSGELSNPLLVLPLQPVFATERPSAGGAPENDRLIGAGYQAFEDSVLKKLQKAAEKQK